MSISRRLLPMRMHQSGMTLLELVMAIVILGVGIAGVMTAFATMVRNSADPLVHKQMLSIAEQMLEEISLQPFAPAAPAQVNTTGPCPSRESFNDILDYDNLKTTGGFCDSTGTPLPQLSAYNVEVHVNQAASLTTLSGTGNLGGGKTYQIKVTVTHGSDSLTLTGWRTNYAAGLP
ncbi:MAG TPA: prepilin-type N-terminal cleavage/methylation domain-containing protein [Noviherbaspirillum sp.]|uniref:type IV pilus modification PilV family protein n=1 Tax=Noviherbaspirillum sp. TaxID=1926288 RepID=UPI002B497B09|nr:prepilin-type N-terminal cleavage/methylation domain-containing protein [Noviherbaspirillum sp.]HJV84116.1 prepilin-type N-terminal cleavage/methylation domain-containing protein [Noviherbaspirillum sp.]